MIGHILLATDFSTRSDRALRRATIVAKDLGAALSLLHVVDDDQPAHLVRSQSLASKAMLEECARTIADYDGVAVDTRVVAGDAFSGILAAADDADADLIVLGPHRRQLRDVFVGTTAERTVARTNRPVLIAAGAPTAPYDRALVATDLEEDSRSMPKRFAELGLVAAGDVVALHAFDAPVRGMMQRGLSDNGAINDYLMSEELRASDAFDRFMAGIGLRNIRRRVTRIKGSAARTIIESARADDMPLIVVGTSQRKGIERFVVGSVAEDVLGEADRDVLVIPK